MSYLVKLSNCHGRSYVRFSDRREKTLRRGDPDASYVPNGLALGVWLADVLERHHLDLLHPPADALHLRLPRRGQTLDNNGLQELDNKKDQEKPVGCQDGSTKKENARITRVTGLT